MPRYVALLRAINVGGHTVTMAELTRLFGALGLEDVRTFIASGNVVFRTRATGVPALARRIESRLAEALGYEVATFLRTDRELAAVAAYRPFAVPLLAEARTVSVGFLAQPLSAGARKAVLALRTEIDEFHVHGTELYWLCRTGQGESTFSNVTFERLTKAKATFRSMTTVHRLVAAHGMADGAT